MQLRDPRAIRQKLGQARAAFIAARARLEAAVDAQVRATLDELFGHAPTITLLSRDELDSFAPDEHEPPG
jgi:hypothetical protein